MRKNRPSCIVLLLVFYPCLSVAFGTSSGIQSRRFFTTHYSQHYHKPKITSYAKNKSSEGNIFTKETGIYLLSFPGLYNETMSKTNLHVQKLKNWKEYCLGDGGVYFDQRPKALKALNQYLCRYLSVRLQKELEEKCYGRIESVEVAVLSTCARFEILIAVASQSKSSNNEIEDVRKSVVKEATINAIVNQIQLQNRRLSYRIQKVLPFNLMDRPSRIIQGKDEHKERKDYKVDAPLKNIIADKLLVFNENDEAIKRMCLIAAGLQDRPIFRPFSSRDAHIMQQLKRTMEGTVSLKNNSEGNWVESPSSTFCKIIFDASLQSGKAARSPMTLPILIDLKEQSKGADGPPELSQKAAEIAKSMAVFPIADNCISKLKAMQSSSAINEIQSIANSFRDEEARKLAKQLAHVPTMELRQGKSVDIDKVVMDMNAIADKIKCQ